MASELKARKPRAVAVTLASIERTEIDWRWHGYLAMGNVHTAAGEPGAGKSYLLAAVAAAITTGAALPGDDGRRDPAKVLYVVSEDDEAAVLRPRLEAMGADLDRILVKAEVQDGSERRPLLLPTDANLLTDLVDEHEPALVILDPLVAVEDPRLDTNRQAAQRAVFSPLARIASEHGCAIIAVRHTRKSAGDLPTHRIIGSIDSVAAARVVWMVGRDPADPKRRGVAVAKTNLGAVPDSRAFSIGEDGTFGWYDKPAKDLTAEALFAPHESGEDRGSMDDAKAFLQAELAEGPVATKAVQSKARDAGISWRSVERARAALGVKRDRLGAARFMYLPAEEDRQDVPTDGVGGVCGVGGVPSRPTAASDAPTPPTPPTPPTHQEEPPWRSSTDALPAVGGPGNVVPLRRRGGEQL